MKAENASKLREQKRRNIEKEDLSDNKKREKRNRPKTANKIKTNLDINQKDNKINILDIPKIKDKELLTENKIQFLLEDYKSRAMKAFLLFCNKEKEAELERNEIYSEAKTEKEKKRLKNILKMQNAQSVDKIGEFNILIDKKIAEYEKALQDCYKNQKNKK